MALSATTIDTALMALTITGVTCKSLANIPPTVAERDCPIIFPDPENWAGDMSLGIGLETFGVSTGYWECTRTLNYLFLYQKVGADRTAFKPLVAMSDKRDAMVEQFCEINISGVDVLGVTSTPLTVLVGPDGTSFHGFRIGVVVRERMNA
jgi:hypothetical protein